MAVSQQPVKVPRPEQFLGSMLGRPERFLSFLRSNLAHLGQSSCLGVPSGNRLKGLICSPFPRHPENFCCVLEGEEGHTEETTSAESEEGGKVTTPWASHMDHIGGRSQSHPGVPA